MHLELYHDTLEFDRDMRIRAALESYRHNRRIEDVLLVGFDQHGRWLGLKQRLNGADFPLWMTASLSAEVIPKARLTTTSVEGEIALLCSWVDSGDGRVDLPFYKIAGDLRAVKGRAIHAPRLSFVGGEMSLGSAEVVEIPRLQHIGGSLWAGSVISFQAEALERVAGLYLCAATSLRAPELRVASGELLATRATRVELPKLSYVLADMNLNCAAKVELPSLRQVEGAIQADKASVIFAPELARVAGFVSANRARSVHMPKLTLAPHEISAPRAGEFIRLNEAGERALHASICDERAGPVKCDFTRILGDLLIDKATRVDVPNLIFVGGSFDASSAKTIHAPLLTCVGEDLCSESAPGFWAAGVVCGGAWYAHPDARANWLAMLARQALNDGPGLEL